MKFKLTLLVSFLALFSVSNLSGSDKKLLNRVTVYLKKPVIELPASRGIHHIENAAIRNNALQKAFKNAGVLKIKRTVPSFNPADTLKTLKNGAQVRLSDLSRFYTIELPDTSTIKEIKKSFEKLDVVKHAEFVYKFINTDESDVFPDDPDFMFEDDNGNGQFDPGETPGKQWAYFDFLNQSNPQDRADINLPEAWGYTTGASDIIIGMVEETGAYFYSIDPDPLTELEGRGTGLNKAFTGDAGHSIATAGVCVANTNNNNLLAGVDWNARFFSSPHSSSSDYFAEAVWACVENDCRIINNSWSSEYGEDGSYSTLLAVRNAYLCGALVVAAMGNHEGNQDRFPACYSDLVLSIAASNRVNAWPYFSNYNYYVDLTAPGGSDDGNLSHDILVLKNGGCGTRYLFGTSFSTPMVSGVASLMMSMRDDIRAEDVEAILKATAIDIKDPGWDKYTGFGKINAGDAVKRLSSAYTLERNTAAGGTSIQMDSDWLTWSFLPSFAVYGVKRYRIEKNVTFEETYVSAPLVWGNISGTQGFHASNPHYEVPWCGPKEGTITTSGATLQTYVFRVLNLYYPYNQFWYPCAPSEVEFAYTVLGKAPTTSGTLNEDETWIDIVNITGDVTVPYGITLTIVPGTMVKFGSGKKLTINGTLDAQGTADNHIVFTRSNTSSTSRTYWKQINLTSGSSWSFDYIEMYGASYGIRVDYASGLIQRSFFEENGIPIYLYHSDNVYIKDCQFSNSNYGIAGLYSDGVAIHNNIINNCYYHGIYLYKSSANIKGTTIENTTKYDGISLSTYSDIDMNKVIAYPNAELNNRIADNKRYGVYITSTASADLGHLLYMQMPYMRGGFNQFDHGSGTYDVKNSSSNKIYAELNWWNNQALYGSFYTSPTADAYGFQLPKATGADESGQVYQLIAEAWEFEYIDSTYTKAINVLNRAAELAPDDSVDYRILCGLARLYNKTDDKQGLLENLDQLYATYSDQLLGKIALDYSVKVSAGLRDFDEALERSEEIIAIWSFEPNSQEALASALFDQGMLYLNMNNNSEGLEKSTSENATNNFCKIINNYPDTEAAWLVSELFGLEKSVDSEETTLPEVYALRQNYPNPFNPTTTIAYDLPEQSHVILIIYNISGREVVKLVDGNLHEGFRHAIWDGKDKSGIQVSSGIYLYSIRTSSGFNATKKMVLVR